MRKLRRKVRKVSAWKLAAMKMYHKLYGSRCLKCSQRVEDRDAELYVMEGLDELLLVHRRCKP